MKKPAQPISADPEVLDHAEVDDFMADWETVNPTLEERSGGEKSTHQTIKQRLKKAKGRKRTAVLHLRTLPELKAQWEQAATTLDVSLTGLVEAAVAKFLEEQLKARGVK